MTDTKTQILQWFATGRVGASSRTIALAGVGIQHKNPVGPSDPSDLKRCMDMLVACPSVTLNSVVKMYPWYKPFVDNWNELVSMYESEASSGKAPLLYKRMKELQDESMRLKGFVKNGNRWTKSEAA
tara:strand:- start:8 stop:388 length:381 start_codon:yes stop_codon:yes gene_type:complete